MTKTQQLWLKASRLLSEADFFDAERERVLAEHHLLSSRGLGRVSHQDLEAARDELRTGGQYEGGIRNTLEYFVEGRVSLSYRLRGCGWARPFNAPAPLRRTSYSLKHAVERYLREKDQRRGATGIDRYTSNGAFVCAALMVGLRAWARQDSLNPEFRLGEPWAVAGLQPEDYGDPDDQRMAKYWRWAVQQDISGPCVEDFILDTVAALYAGADLQKMQDLLQRACFEAREVYYDLRRKFGLRAEEDRDFWYEKGEGP